MGTYFRNYICPQCNRCGSHREPFRDIRCCDCRSKGICCCGYDLRGLPVLDNELVRCPECGNERVRSKQNILIDKIVF